MGTARGLGRPYFEAGTYREREQIINDIDHFRRIAQVNHYYPGIIDASRLDQNGALHEFYGAQAHSLWQVGFIEEREYLGFGCGKSIPLLSSRTVVAALIR
jgi:hypothetical protein